MELINKADQLAGYLRDDRLHMAKYDTESKARKVLNGLSGSFILFDNTKDEALKELNINTTTQLINDRMTPNNVTRHSKKKCKER